MRIGELFETRVAEKIEPVIKVGETGDDEKLASEIGSYVVTPIIEQYLDDILEHYTDTFLNKTTEIAIWISGYFGSGKSHLATMICSDCDRMVTASLRLANRRWQDRVNEVVIKPLREEIGQKREALNAVDEELQQLSRHEFESKFRLEDEEDRLKREIKALNQEIDRIKGRVERLRSTIEDWKCHEAAGWEPWLAEQPMYDPISSVDGSRRPPTTVVEWVAQEQAYHPDINDGVRVNIAPLQKAGLLAADVLAKKDLDKAIADRAQWRADERRWCREGKLPQPGWWPEA